MNTAVSSCDPVANIDEEVVTTAVPSATVAGTPMSAVPSLNCTVPTNVDGVTAAISVTGAPCATVESGKVVSAALVARTAVEWVLWSTPAGGTALDTPTRGSNAPAATATMKAPVVGRWKDLLLRMIGLLFPYPVTSRATTPGHPRPASNLLSEQGVEQVAEQPATA